jgi:predicted nucleic acid-binding protein
MNAFIDTSSLFKKYVDEPGSEKFDRLLENISGIIISPITILEINSVLERRIREKTLKTSDAEWIENEFLTDYAHFAVVKWSEDLISQSTRIIRRYQLKVLDSIQLSSAILAKAEIFITSDKRLFEACRNEISGVSFI